MKMLTKRCVKCLVIFQFRLCSPPYIKWNVVIARILILCAVNSNYGVAYNISITINDLQICGPPKRKKNWRNYVTHFFCSS